MGTLYDFVAYAKYKRIFMEIAFMQFGSKQCFSKLRKGIDPIWNTLVKIGFKILNYVTYYVYILSIGASYSHIFYIILIG